MWPQQKCSSKLFFLGEAYNFLYDLRIYIYIYICVCVCVCVCNSCASNNAYIKWWLSSQIFWGFKIETANIRKINKSIWMLVAFFVQFYRNYLESNIFIVVELSLPS